MHRRDKENTMDTLIKAPIQLKLAGAMLAIAALVIGLMAVAFTVNQAQAQSKTYPDPQPCGPGHADVPKGAVEQITTGKIVFFDSYWDIPTRTINNNLCPPAIVQKAQGRVTVPARGDANIDIAKTVIHVTDDYKVTVVDSASPNYDSSAVSGPTIDLAEYTFLKEGLEDGVVFDANGTATDSDGDPVQVYWLRLNDPDTSADETSDLVLGFSTELFDEKYWEDRNGDKALRYEYHSERDYKSEVHGPHFFAFAAPKANGGVQNDPLWSSVDADDNQIWLDAGEKFREVQWVFTEPGTHHIQANVKGYVRQEKPAGAGDDWKKISPDEKTVTSEVRRYTIQTGPLTLNKYPPVFTAGERSVARNAAAGTIINGPIPVWNATRQPQDIKFEVLNYPDGSVSQEFETYPYDPDGYGTQGVQLRVKSGADLAGDSRGEYWLTVTVSDGKDREGHPDDAVDHWITVKVLEK